MLSKEYKNTRELLEALMEGGEAIKRENPRGNETSYFFMVPKAQSPTGEEVINVPDGIDPQAFKAAGYKVPETATLSMGNNQLSTKSNPGSGLSSNAESGSYTPFNAYAPLNTSNTSSNAVTPAQNGYGLLSAVMFDKGARIAEETEAELKALEKAKKKSNSFKFGMNDPLESSYSQTNFNPMGGTTFSNQDVGLTTPAGLGSSSYASMGLDAGLNNTGVNSNYNNGLNFASNTGLNNSMGLNGLDNPYNTQDVLNGGISSSTGVTPGVATTGTEPSTVDWLNQVKLTTEQKLNQDALSQSASSPNTGVGSMTPNTGVGSMNVSNQMSSINGLNSLLNNDERGVNSQTNLSGQSLFGKELGVSNPEDPFGTGIMPSLNMSPQISSIHENTGSQDTSSQMCPKNYFGEDMKGVPDYVLDPTLDPKAYGKYILEKNKDKFKEPSVLEKWMFDGGGRKIGFFLQGLANSPFNIAKYPAQWLGMDLKPLEAQTGGEHAIEEAGKNTYDAIAIALAGQVAAGIGLFGKYVKAAEAAKKAKDLVSYQELLQQANKVSKIVNRIFNQGATLQGIGGGLSGAGSGYIFQDDNPYGKKTTELVLKPFITTLMKKAPFILGALPKEIILKKGMAFLKKML